MFLCITCNVYHMRKFCRFFNCMAWFDTVEFNWLPFPNMFGIRVLIGLSLHLHAHIAYKIDTGKIIAAFCRISYWMHDLIRLNSIVCPVQRTRCTMMWYLIIDYDINWLCLKCIYWWGYLDSLILILHMKELYKKITTGNWLDAKNDLSCRTVVKRLFRRW